MGQVGGILWVATQALGLKHYTHKLVERQQRAPLLRNENCIAQCEQEDILGMLPKLFKAALHLPDQVSCSKAYGRLAGHLRQTAWLSYFAILDSLL